jgi:hypothetical protein
MIPPTFHDLYVWIGGPVCVLWVIIGTRMATRLITILVEAWTD